MIHQLGTSNKINSKIWNATTFSSTERHHPHSSARCHHEQQPLSHHEQQPLSSAAAILMENISCLPKNSVWSLRIGER
jgi:hypothetical protein